MEMAIPGKRRIKRVSIEIATDAWMAMARIVSGINSNVPAIASRWVVIKVDDTGCLRAVPMAIAT
jgi:hypothetical protein